MSATYTNVLIHLVFSTKNRAPLIVESVQDELRKYISGIARGEGGNVIAINAVVDHVHLLLRLSPSKPLADLVRAIKASSSRWMKTRKPISRTFRWQDGYSAFSVSESRLRQVAQYIERQQEHHRRRDFRDELLALLKRHSIEYEDRYLWD